MRRKGGSIYSIDVEGKVFPSPVLGTFLSRVGCIRLRAPRRVHYIAGDEAVNEKSPPSLIRLPNKSIPAMTIFSRRYPDVRGVSLRNGCVERCRALDSWFLEAYTYIRGDVMGEVDGWGYIIHMYSNSEREQRRLFFCGARCRLSCAACREETGL